MNKSRWDEILATAARLFRENGYRATTMEDIARELGITKPALYYYINTKHDLLYAICESAMDLLTRGEREIENAPGGVEDKLKKLVTFHVNMFSKYGDITNVYLVDENELPPEQREKIRSQSREYETIYRRLLEQGVSEGRFREMDIPVVVRAISGMCNWLSTWYRPDGDLTADEIAEIFCELLLNGCRKPST